MESTRLDQQYFHDTMFPKPVKGQVINIYHSCDPPGTQILQHFTASKHKISNPLLDPYASSPSRAQIPRSGRKLRTVVRCAERSCAKCSNSDVFTDLTLAVAKSHGITRVPLAPSPRAHTAQEKLADGELRGEWMYRDLKPGEFVIEPLRPEKLDVGRMGKIGKVSSVLKWLKKVSLACEVAISEPRIQEIQADDLPDTTLQASGLEDKNKSLAASGDWQQLKKQTMAKISQSTPPHADRLTQANLLQQAKLLRSPPPASASLAKVVTSRNSALRQVKQIRADRPIYPATFIHNGYAHQFSTPDSTPMMADALAYIHGYMPAYNENDFAMPHYAIPDLHSFRPAMLPVHQQYVPSTYHTLPGFWPSIPQDYGMQWPTDFTAPPVQGPSIGHKRQRESGDIETEPFDKRVKY